LEKQLELAEKNCESLKKEKKLKFFTFPDFIFLNKPKTLKDYFCQPWENRVDLETVITAV